MFEAHDPFMCGASRGFVLQVILNIMWSMMIQILFLRSPACDFGKGVLKTKGTSGQVSARSRASGSGAKLECRRLSFGCGLQVVWFSGVGVRVSVCVCSSSTLRAQSFIFRKRT